MNAGITTPVVSIKNPLAGRICVPAVGEIIRDIPGANGEICIKGELTKETEENTCQKNILILSTSLRKDSNSDALAGVPRGAEAGHHAVMCSLRGKALGFCVGCLSCQKTKRCVIRDDAPAIVQQMKQADILVFATPIYYYEMCGQMKTLLDRANPLYTDDYAFRDVYPLSAAADDAPTRTAAPSAGWRAGLNASSTRGSPDACSRAVDAPALSPDTPLCRRRTRWAETHSPTPPARRLPSKAETGKEADRFFLVFPSRPQSALRTAGALPSARKRCSLPRVSSPVFAAAFPAPAFRLRLRASPCQTAPEPHLPAQTRSLTGNSKKAAGKDGGLIGELL